MNFEDCHVGNAQHADICYFGLRYLLSFPLGLINWFSDDFIPLVFWFSIPNALIIANARSIWKWIASPER